MAKVQELTCRLQLGHFSTAELVVLTHARPQDLSEGEATQRRNEGCPQSEEWNMGRTISRGALKGQGPVTVSLRSRGASDMVLRT